VGIVLAQSLLWAAYEVEVCVNDQVVSLIPSDLGAKIKAAYAGGGDVNLIEKIGLLVSQHMDQLDIVPVNVGGNNNDGGSGGAGGGGGSAGGGEGGQDVTDNVCSQIYHLQQIVGDMRNEVNSFFSDQRRHINTLNANLKRIALLPDCVVVQPNGKELLMRIGGWLCRNARGICGCCGGSGSRDWVRGSRQRHSPMLNGEQISFLSCVERCSGI
jgi:hypothetical protein